MVMLDWLFFLALVIAGFFFGILSAMVGIGGGLLNVPFLDFIVGLDPGNATFISTFVIIFTSTSGTITYRSEKKIDYRTGLQYLALAIPGVVVGGILAELIPRVILRFLFGLMITGAGIRGIIKANTSVVKEEKSLPLIPPAGMERRKIIDKDGNIWEYDVKIGSGRLFALFGGFIAGLLGVGGGIIFVPVLNAVSGLPIHIAAPTSTMMIIVVSLLAFITRSTSRLQAGTFDVSLLTTYGIPLIIGSVLGARVGALKVKKIKSRQLLTFFWSIATIAGLRVVLTELINYVS